MHVVKTLKLGLIDELKAQLSSDPSLINWKHNGFYLLHWAVLMNSVESVKVLLKCPGICLNSQDAESQVRVHYACDR